MFLKRLEVMGFKSFADRIGIDFVPGVTAVVGPNGSGKSNVTDAIRWVLGEQSAKSLRGAKMEDVIFSGSDSRKPLNFAEVTLILDNADGRVPLDYSEVSVTRRVFRSGESAYLLNKQNCRLKDITDLFMDSGLGKEAFSIISQGRVDEILNSKAEERRSIFEEAAGVLKYKQRKKKAEVKLNETDENLNRVLDILHELDGRMEPLQIQASTARDYLDMNEQLKDADIALLAFDAGNLEQELEQLTFDAAAHTEKEQQLSADIHLKERAVAKIRRTLADLDNKIDQAQNSLVEASAETEKWQGRKLLMSEKKSNAHRQAKQLQGNVDAEKIENVFLQKKHTEQLVLLEERKVELQTIRAAIKQLEEQLNRSPADIENEIENCKSIYIELMNEQATVKNELKNIGLQAQQLSESTGRIESQRTDFTAELSKLESEKTKAEQNAQEIRTLLDDKRQQYKDSEAAYQQQKQNFEQKQSMLFQAYQSQKQLAARIGTLQELEADFSGFFQGVREVLVAREKGHLAGIRGAVAELAQVEKTHAKAIETALGASSQHIVTENEQHAREAIDFLRKKRAGRSTFLPMTVMKARKIPEHTLATVREHPSYISMAFELVSYDSQYSMIIENLLGNVIIATDLKGATAIARATGNRFRVVTLEGDIVNAGGSMTGGASKMQASFFTRKAELEQLLVQASELKETILNAEKTVQKEQADVKAAEESIQILRAEGEKYRDMEAESAIILREIEAVLKTTIERFRLFEAQQKNREYDLTAITGRQETAASRLESIVKELHAITVKIDELTLFKQQNESARDQVLEKLAEQKSLYAVTKERVTQLTASEAELSERLEKSNRKLQEHQKELQWIQSEEAAKVYSDEEILREIESWSAKKVQIQQTVNQTKEQRAEQQNGLNELEENLREQQRIYKGYVEAIRICEVKSTRLDVQIQSLIAQLEASYQLTLEQAKQFEMMDEETVVRRKVKLLKQSIEELGPVHLGAIEEFDHVSDRHAFLTEQRNDLNEAKDTLRTLIREMDGEMTSRFDETFHAIRKQFQRVFKELFGGGSADLVLTDPQDLLMTGVEIIAQPPGKKLQNLTLLSGGERALTAIALLFAILNVRPVPFCVLDEVEAALDESNVVRYSQYLKKFSEDTQFIVITHRKGTMEGADVLYGITMQESGISKLVSVKLEEKI
ncbi:chromosome segregation protein SMC [Microbacterium sp. APC 3898]|uniref:Chromosome partition protein Smc n=1 Tax=Planococcus notacanthi TaxID=3035188 RepID=A0ABT7ZG93_9BACL|nr:MULTISPECIES: chromosome segregation protein SMC [Terrabacteria group]MDN3426131.1 chromosome segregation protein SMC [Planococcus sp. APC 4016]MDN3497828.1 chromosome segregation protein SMC [Microbacterium sp. APC 3898]